MVVLLPVYLFSLLIGMKIQKQSRFAVSDERKMNQEVLFQFFDIAFQENVSYMI